MRNDVVVKRHAWRTAAVALLSGLAVFGVAAGAFAHDDDDDGHGWKHHGRHFVPPGHVYYYSAPAYYAPRPVVVYPAPVYEVPAPAYYPPPGLTINIPLR